MTMMNPYLVVELVVDNVVQLIVVLLDVDVESPCAKLYMSPPFLLLHLGDAHSGCCTLLMPIPDVAPPEVKTCCKMTMVRKKFLVEHEVDVIDGFCCWS